MKDYYGAYVAAKAAGIAAGNDDKPTPMIVGQSTSLFGNEIDLTKPVHFVADGCCGFAWVTVKPGNCGFARWLKTHSYARPAYGGGVQIWIYEHNQSVSRKEAHAEAMAKVLREKIDDPKVQISAGSRLD